MISYDDALANLLAMFPDMDADTVATVLRDHGGHMERTIDALLIMKGQTPVNSVEVGPAQVARDEAVALELQRRMAIQAAMEDRAIAARTQQRQQNRVVMQARPRNEPAELPPPSVMMTDPILDTFEAVGTAARDKMKELWDKMNGRAPTAPKTKQKNGGKYQAVATEDDLLDGDDNEDDDEITFDSSLTKRYAVDTEEDGDESNADGVELSSMASKTTSSTTTTTTTSSSSSSGTKPENKKTK